MIPVFLFVKSFSDMYVLVYVHITLFYQCLFRDDLIISIYSFQHRNPIHFEECHALSKRKISSSFRMPGAKVTSQPIADMEFEMQ